MTPDQITQLRQHLREIRKMIIEEYVLVCPHKFGICKHNNEHCPIFRIDQALALLPCSACNGTKRKFIPQEYDAPIIEPCPTCNGTRTKTYKDETRDGISTTRGPCPDCQQNSP